MAILKRYFVPKRPFPRGRGCMFGILACCLVGSALAQQPTQAQRDAVKQSCRSDYQSYCASVPTGGQASLQCLQEHLSALSPACQAAVGGIGHAPSASQATPPAAPPPATSRRQEATLMRRACGRDFSAYCSEVRPGEGRALACLEGNQSRLSPSCRGALAELHGGR
jgi:cysteine rich repeat protein